MKLVIATILVLIVAASVAVYALQDPGYLMISFRDWTLETSVTLFIVVLLLAFGVFYLLLRLLIGGGLLPRRMQRWRRLRAARVARRRLERGMMKLNLGQWQAAEAMLLKSARHAELAPLAYLGAARAAQGLGVEARRDGYIQLAQQQRPKDTLALSLAEAHIQADFGHPEQALQTLRQLPNHQQNASPTLKAQAEYCEKSGDWPGLLALLPRLKQHKVLPQQSYYQTEQRTYAGMIRHIAEHQDAATLWQLWEKMPADLRSKEAIMTDFTIAMINFGQSDAVADLLYRHLNRRWSDALVYLYGRLEGDAEIHLARGRNWLRKQPENPVLLLSLGRLALRAHQWPAAREYLEGSLKITPNAEAYQELGNLLAFLNEQTLALECYRRGLALSADSFVQPQLKSGIVQLARPGQVTLSDAGNVSALRLEGQH